MPNLGVRISTRSDISFLTASANARPVARTTRLPTPDPIATGRQTKVDRGSQNVYAPSSARPAPEAFHRFRHVKFAFTESPARCVKASRKEILELPCLANAGH